MVVACEKSDMPSANSVWGTYLRRNGFRRNIIPDEYPEDYTVEEFSADHQNGAFVLGLDGHVVTVVDGFYWDTWDSGQEIPIYYWISIHKALAGLDGQFCMKFGITIGIFFRDSLFGLKGVLYVCYG